MSRPRTATKILQLRGAFKKNPDRAKERENEPVVKNAISKTPPRHLSESEKKVWRELVKSCPAGVATTADSQTMELAVVLMNEFRTDRSDFNAAKISALKNLLGLFGMNPSDRTKLSVEQPKKENEFDDI